MGFALVAEASQARFASYVEALVEVIGPAMPIAPGPYR
jgi:hypothetical protein